MKKIIKLLLVFVSSIILFFASAWCLIDALLSRHSITYFGIYFSGYFFFLSAAIYVASFLFSNTKDKT